MFKRKESISHLARAEWKREHIKLDCSLEGSLQFSSPTISNFSLNPERIDSQRSLYTTRSLRIIWNSLQNIPLHLYDKLSVFLQGLLLSTWIIVGFQQESERSSEIRARRIFLPLGSTGSIIEQECHNPVLEDRINQHIDHWNWDSNRIKVG